MLRNATTTDTLVSSNFFPEVIANISITVMGLLSRAKSSSQLEEKLSQEFENTGQILEALEHRLNTTISKGVNEIRAQSSNVRLRENRTRDIMTSVYDFLWMSVYIINADVIPRENESELVLERLRAIAANLTTIAIERVSSYAPVLLNLNMLLNSTDNIMKQTKQIVNVSLDTDATLRDSGMKLDDFDKAVSAQKLISDSLYSQSLQLMNVSDTILQSVFSTEEEINSLNLNSSDELVVKLNSSNRTLYTQIEDLKQRTSAIRDSFGLVHASVKEFLNLSSAAIKNANLTSESTEKIYLQVLDTSERVQNTTIVANETFVTAQKMLLVLLNYEEAIFNSTQSLNSSLEELNKVCLKFINKIITRAVFENTGEQPP